MILPQIQNTTLTSIAQTIGSSLALSSTYYVQVLSFKALAAPSLKLLVPDGNVRFYWLK